MILAGYVDRWGAPNVLGRQLRAKEIRQIVYCENVIFAYQSRAAALNWTTWEAQNPEMASLLMEAQEHSEI